MVVTLLVSLLVGLALSISVAIAMAGVCAIVFLTFYSGGNMLQLLAQIGRAHV